MSDDKRRPRPAAQYGPTAEAVAQNVKRLREARGLTIYALSGALGTAGRPITASAIAKIERQQRQVTVDDLAALAVVLKVSPSALFLPLKDGPHETVEVTGAGSVSAEDAWEWADGNRPLKMTPGTDMTELLEFELYSRPAGRRSTFNAGRELFMKSEARNANVIKELERDRTEGGGNGPSVD
ncbi:helix-turn-helix domain-containing protein [Streptomyces violarus]|uniref:Transcriptional regulator with XRE-family HTH domain n=1 Tax=Streptomyces violarus TaxID=67380 RepID=A0A7W4ZZ17_9ACTN|nr:MULTISPECIES: helix-turn-helix transcriptional regulator [Streptomyces]MBB3081266.1 transcriptional regulator with XRE-family HTH domain [Streptomyces violarus]WRU00368.1 helix-turn-helix transcriptional regulator [Streptomyces sp. CGMCC 4.1772]